MEPAPPSSRSQSLNCIRQIDVLMATPPFHLSATDVRGFAALDIRSMRRWSAKATHRKPSHLGSSCHSGPAGSVCAAIASTGAYRVLSGSDINLAHNFNGLRCFWNREAGPTRRVFILRQSGRSKSMNKELSKSPRGGLALQFS